jgi:hypothetical protein
LKRMQINLIKRGKDFQRKGFLKGNPQSGTAEMFVNFLSLFSLQNSRGLHSPTFYVEKLTKRSKRV